MLSPSFSRITKRMRSSITELSFHGFHFPAPFQAKKCNPCLRYVLLPMCRAAHLSGPDTWGSTPTTGGAKSHPQVPQNTLSWQPMKLSLFSPLISMASSLSAQGPLRFELKLVEKQAKECVATFEYPEILSA